MRRRVIALALPVVALGLSSCGTTVTVSTPSGTSASAAVAGTTSPMSPAPASTTFAVGQSVPAKTLSDLSNAAIKKAGSVHLKMSMMGEMTANADMTFAGDQPQMTMKMSGMGQNIAMVYVDGQLFLKMPMLGSKYIKIDPDGTDALSKEMGSSVKQLQSLNGVGELGDSIDWKVTAAGPEGTTFAADVTEKDLRDAAGSAGATDLPTGDLPFGSMKVTMTYDAQDRPVKSVVMMGGRDMVTMTMSDWGVPVTVTAPPSSEVTTAPKDLDSLGA
ncbi:hypothetical protein ATK17_0229 [Branchiibius hedensis]|uniref:Lipoprotein LprG n=1 Tax=Branchiibius hedensis TaxID=672460 RepID=A0A2Y8ZRM4_9MICO|nr:hypothetical protein [Branchiibius hedensis]PWJ24141.1 hypothetical protein ATK17_0229 [Branchiibius hedensis]SSA32959.1 hypothetical protein SAMN04489750_0229 [Branchiibius hedensis]